MSQGKTHDRINLLIGSILTGLLIGFERNILIVSGFVFGFFLATFIVSPDLDLGPKKRTKFLQIFLYPYSLFFKHRGKSHHFLFGTLTRVFYGVFVFMVIIFILNKMNYLSIKPQEFISSSWHFIVNYDYSLVSYKFLTWTYLGMFMADLCHIFLDKISTKINRIKRKIF